jgi:hypothetical protein
MVRGPTTDPKFLGTLESWFQSQLAMLVQTRVRAGGGHIDFGLYPPALDDTKDVIHAIVPDKDGIVRAVPY